MDTNTTGTRGGPGGRDRIMAAKRRKNTRKKVFFGIYLLVMPKYWGKLIFRFPEVGEKQKTKKKKRVRQTARQ